MTLRSDATSDVLRILLVSATLAAAVMAACRTPPRPAPGPPADPRRCALAPVPGETPEARAVRCAEWFIVRNGYTTRRPVADSTQIAWEAGEPAGPAAEQLARRRGMLREKAFVVCRGRREGHGPAFGVGFVLRPDPPSPSGRAVTMDTAFAEIHFERGRFDLTMALADTASCRVVPGPSRR
jgi:hypothetical protein